MSASPKKKAYIAKWKREKYASDAEWKAAEKARKDAWAKSPEGMAANAARQKRFRERLKARRAALEAELEAIKAKQRKRVRDSAE